MKSEVYVALRPQVEIVRCEKWDCRLPIAKRKAAQYWLFEPFQDDAKPDITYYCRECYDNYEAEGEFYCDSCNRDIYDSNGYRVNYKLTEDGIICVRCFQEQMFEHGHTEEQLDSGKVWCDWYNETELIDNGFE